ncbi:sorbosone dehydrogenase family protein [filamentous cyanobacterium LEGE 11480]|uniref:Sorbosone dehydrogenase family protein n=2 Tax=Romeriopsis TaxID=2992131 RepID=A0A928VRM6_9CYAN|nr:sorbosone dehydrogenase family protein [Romeriopsis navalis LEGE 11480]
MPGPETTTSDITPKLAPPKEQTIATKTFKPQKIAVTLKQLPKPYATKSVAKPSRIIPVPDYPQLKTPPGFSINVFAEGLDGPRWLALTPNGEVLVTETRQNRIRLLADQDQNGVADFNRVFASANNGLNIPFGMAFARGAFFLGNTAEVRRYNYSKNQQQLIGTGEKITDLPGGGYNQHWTRNVIADAKGEKLYVSVGSKSNANEEDLPRASVQVMNLDGSDRQTFASGLRNPVGLAIQPETGDLYTTVNERDGLGDDLVPDYFTRIRQDEFYGWPYTYITPSLLDPRHTQDGRSRRPELAAKTRTPDVLFQSHSAALGVQFYTENRFPEKYRNGAFVAFRGSWNRDQGTGYKIVFIPFNQESKRPLGYYEDFVTGFLNDPAGPTTWGRPVGLLVLPDGSLLFTEEANGRIYRVAYTAPPKREAPPTDGPARPIDSLPDD